MNLAALPTPIAQAAVPRDVGVVEFLTDPQRWRGSDGILDSLGDTVVLCIAVIIVSILLAVPIAAYLAHLRRFELSSAWIVNIGRAIPTFGVAGLLVPISLRAGYGFEPWPIFIALVLLTVPPMYLSTYTAIRQVSPSAVDSARAVGYTERDVLLQVEVPLAMTVIFTGIRVAAVQVVATEPIRAFLGGDGLGRYVRDGLGQNNASLTIAGAILIGALAAATGLVFVAIERFAKPAGVRRLGGGKANRPQALTEEDDAAQDQAPAVPQDEVATASKATSGS